MVESFKPEYKDEDEGMGRAGEDATGDDSNGKIKTGLWLQHSLLEREAVSVVETNEESSNSTSRRRERAEKGKEAKK